MAAEEQTLPYRKMMLHGASASYPGGNVQKYEKIQYILCEYTTGEANVVVISKSHDVSW